MSVKNAKLARKLLRPYQFDRQTVSHTNKSVTIRAPETHST